MTTSAPSSVLTTIKTPEPHPPALLKYFSNLWIMFYRHGMNATLSKSFYFEPKNEDPDLRIVEAKKRAESHCKIMGYHYNFIRPLVCDLDHEEAYKLGKLEMKPVKGEIVP